MGLLQVTSSDVEESYKQLLKNYSNLTISIELIKLRQSSLYNPIFGDELGHMLKLWYQSL